MVSSLSHECLIYPGEYAPIPESGAATGVQAPGSGAKAVEPAMNMIEDPDSFCYEVFLPGIKREEIIVHFNENGLIITVVPVQKNEQPSEKQLVHEFDKVVMKRQIKLPENADPEFVCAEYKRGVLKLHIPKSEGTPNPCNRQIIVY